MRERANECASERRAKSHLARGLLRRAARRARARSPRGATAPVARRGVLRTTSRVAIAAGGATATAAARASDASEGCEKVGASLSEGGL